MRVGVPKEIKLFEYRVGLTPDAVREFVAAGHEVLVETGAGSGIDACDAAYTAAGAEVVDTPAEVFARAQMIVKVKEPQSCEWVKLREGQILFAYLHLAAGTELTRGLLASGCTAVAYETVLGPDGASLPLLVPMSEVAGRLAIGAAGVALERTRGGRGLLLGGVPGVSPARVAILGGGTVGTQAARMAAGLGADVVILDRSLSRLRWLDDLFQGRIRTRYATMAAIEAEVLAADVTIGAVLVPGATAPKLVTRPMLSGMKKGAVLVDVAIDQGGCFATSRPTTHGDPTYILDGIVHYCVANMPGAVPLTASHALAHATLPYGLALADGGLWALASDQGLRAGLNVHRGFLTHKAVADSLGMAVSTPEAVLAA
jgi:alanine dehydrogenase